MATAATTTVKIGDKVYYTGDMVNGPATGTVASVNQSRFGTHIRIVWAAAGGVQKQDSTVSPANFSRGPGCRFWLLEEWKADQAAKTEAMKRDYERLLAAKK